LPRGDAKAAGFDPDKLAAIDGLLKRAASERQIAGGAALVARRGKIVHLATAGMQDVEAGVPISEATIYRIASMTKPVTSVAAMMLVEEGKLALSDPVARFIPEFKQVRLLSKDAQPDQPLERSTTAVATPLTVRHLLTHTSGITYGLWDRPLLGKLYREAGVSDGLIETPGTTGTTPAGWQCAADVRARRTWNTASIPCSWPRGRGASGHSLDSSFRPHIPATGHAGHPPRPAG
jgi:CubicO group peptidase (beta-lactamase class C family)